MSEKEQFAAICKKTYEAQAKWYLNGFWDDGAKDQAEEVWKFAHLFISLDPKKKEGFDLDEFLSHKFLEALGETLTVVQLREKLKKIDLDANGRMSLIEYLCFKFTRTAKQIIDAPQAENLKIVEEAQKLLDEVQHAFAEVSQKLQEQSDALEHQRKEEESVRQTAERLKKSEEESRRAEEDARKAAEEVAQKEAEVKKSEEILQAAEDKVRKAEEDLKAAIQALKDQEDARTNTIKSLEAKANDSSLSTVHKAKAANELAQAKESSDFEIRKTKITQEAALRVVEKERKVAEQATNKAKEASDAAAAATSAAKAAASAAENKRKQVEQERIEAEEATKRAEQATRELEVKKKEVEASFAEAEKKVEEAKKFLEEQREKCQSKGSFWWIERDLKEQEKFKPKRAQKS